MSARRILACGLVLGLAFAASASADVLYSQPNDRPNQISFFSDAVSGQFFSQRMADDFVLGGDAMISGVKWWGGSQNFQFDDLTNMTSFTVLILGDDNGPDLGNVLASITLDTASTNPIETENLLFAGGQQYEQEIAFGAPVAVNGGETLWVSIGATLVQPAGDAWVWSGSTVGNLVNATDFFDGSGFIVFDPTANDLAFEIIGVPEPATAGLLALGAVGLLRRKREVSEQQSIRVTRS